LQTDQREADIMKQIDQRDADAMLQAN
jgi:hypothetical protein